jgi:hypothetical protein
MPALHRIGLIAPALAMLLAWSGVAQAQPTLSHAQPAGVRPGEATEVDLFGDKLDGKLQFWTSFPCQVEVLHQEAGRVRCRITTPADAPLGVGGLIVGNEQAASDVVWLMVDSLANAADAGNNHTPQSAQELALPTAVDGTLDGPEADYFRVTLAQGQRLAIDVLASRLGSAADPVLRLLDDKGQELLAIDDDASLAADCRLAFTASAAGTYLLEVRDSKYQSGVRYRLRVGDLPLIRTSYPLGVRRGSTAWLTFPTLEETTAAAMPVTAPAARRAAEWVVAARRAPDGVPEAADVILSDWPEFTELEPNDDAAQPTRVVVPCGVNGILQNRQDVDVYEFAARQNQRLLLRTTARSAGSPAYPLLRLYDSQHKLLAESPVSDTDEFLLAHTFPADGLYHLAVEDLTRSGGSQYVYRVDISDTPFTLNLKNAQETQFRLTTPAGDGAFAIDIQCQRYGYDGPIDLMWEPAPAGLALYNARIPEKAVEHRLIVAPGPAVSSGDLRVIRLRGNISIEGREVSSPVLTNARLRARWPTMVHPPRWHDGLFIFSTSPSTDPLFTVATEANHLFLARGLEPVETAITVERKNGEFKDKLQIVSPADLPAGLSLAVKEENDRYTITVNAPADFPAGQQSLRLGAYGNFKGRGQLATLELPLEINDPLALEAAVNGPLKAGEKQTLHVKLTRRGRDRQPVVLSLMDLPAGVSATPPTVAADQDAVDIELSAEAGAAAAQATVRVVGTTKYGEKNVTASAATKFELAAP